MFFCSINLATAPMETGSIIWDSGASVHIMTPGALQFMTNKTGRNTTVFMNHAPAKATHAGDVKILVQSSVINLKNVLVVPNSRTNLISIPCLQKRGYSVSFPATKEGLSTMTVARWENHIAKTSEVHNSTHNVVPVFRGTGTHITAKSCTQVDKGFALGANTRQVRIAQDTGKAG